MRVRHILLAAIAAVGVSASADGASFQFNVPLGTPQPILDAFALAGQRWQGNLADNLTIRINLSYGAMDPFILAETHAPQFPATYSSIRNALLYRQQSADDVLAAAHLPASAGLSMLINRTSNNPNGAGSLTPYLDNNGDDNNTIIRTTRANLRALGITAGPGTDGLIDLNSAFTYDTNPADGIDANAYDLVAIATHEIGHVLGVLSGVDALDEPSASLLPDSSMTNVTVMDIFRFSADSFAQGAGTIDFSADARQKYFSIDGGQISIAPLSTGFHYGDGRQAGHWKDNQNLGIFDPTFVKGQSYHISDNDRRLIDAIGFARNFDWRWNQSGGGSWHAPLNWNADGIPAADINVHFARGGQTYSVSFSSPATARSLHVQNDHVTLSLITQSLQVAQDITIADVAGQGASLTLLGGTTSASSLHVGGSATGPGGTGVLSISPSSALNVTNSLRIHATPGSALSNNGGVLSVPVIVNEGLFEQAAGTLNVSSSFTNTGTAIIAGAQNWSPGSSLNINGGNVTLWSNAGSPAARNLAISINGGLLDMESTQHLAALDIPSGQARVSFGADKVIDIENLYLGPTAQLDLHDNTLIVRAAPEDRISVLENTADRIASARAGGAWTGPGLTSSAARFDPSRLSTLAAILNENDAGLPLYTTFAGQSVDANSVLVAYSFYGDSDLNGVVNGDDYFRIDGGYAQNRTGWRNGDFDHNGIVNGDDYFLIDSAFAGQGGYGNGSGQDIRFTVLIPEPGSMALLVCGVLATQRRRRML